MSRIVGILAVFFTVLLGVVGSASASDYRFAVPSMTLEVDVAPDASARLRYEIEFENQRFAKAIDIVDIGLPHADYDRASAKAWLDGRPLTRILPSTYVDPGLEVHLGTATIPPDGSGTLVFEIVVPDLVHTDTTDDTQASLRITPTWFGSSYVIGTTDLKIGVWLPEGADPERVLHHGIHGPADYALGEHDGRVVVGWHYSNTRIDSAHLVGVSFPREVMDRVVVVTRTELLLRWWEGSPDVRLGAFLVLVGVMAVFFFRYSGWTGFSVFGFAVLAVGLLYYSQPRLHFYTGPLWLVLGILMERKVRRARRTYLPPIVSVEGGGIKRGLTAPEAAVLLELPLGRVLTLTVFGMLKKGLLVQTGDDPLAVRVRPELETRERPQRRKAAAALGTVIHAYEHAFLDAVLARPGLAVESIDFTDAMKGLVEHVAERLSGWDLEDTRSYYRKIVERAWRAASSMGELEHRTRAVDRNLEWLMMDDTYPERFVRWERGGYRYRPVWGRSISTGAVGGLGSLDGGSSRSASATPSLGDVGASFAGWSENLAGKLTGSLSPTSIRGSSGIVNLGGADRATGEVLSSLFSGGGGGGGGFGGGCACAGCACACACAGGGR